MATMVAAMAGVAPVAAAQPTADPNSLPNRSDYTLEILDLLRHELVWRERQATPSEGSRLYFAELSLLVPGGQRDVPIGGVGQTGPATLIAFCDVDCGDIVVTVISESGAQLGVSRSGGRSTDVTFQRDGAQSYFARVSIPDCGASYCFYTLGALD